MKELEYPFDTGFLNENRKKIRRKLIDENVNKFTEKKIAVLGGSTTKYIVQVMELFLLDQGIRPVFYESEYNQYYQDAMFPNKELERFEPDIIYIHTTNRNITRYPAIIDDGKAVDEILDAEYTKFSAMWDRLSSIYHCPIIQNNFEMPMYRLLGNKDVSDIHGAGNFIARLNLRFYKYAQEHKDFYICDINYISADYGLKKWSDPFFWHMYKYAVNVDAIPYLSFNVSNIIKSIYGKNKKGMVLDLDNTLWGGVIGDDGADGIELGPEASGGQVYSEFQHYIKAHKALGIILNVDSKNDEENALAGLNHPDGELKPDDFIMIKANWEPKDRNFLQIASELNLGADSLLFIDDNPAERHIVTGQIKGVTAPEIGEAYQYIQNIDRGGYFEVTTLSRDDMGRNEMYKKNNERRKLEASFTNYHEYLLSLDMTAVIRAFESIYMSRIAQLTNKSNQFNLTTRRYTQPDLEKISEDDNYITQYGKLIDRFGDNGVVSLAIGHIIGEECHIDLWLMSCRVLKRDMEYAMMDRFIERCKERGCKTVYGYYYPTKKNKMVQEFYKNMGFSKQSEDCVGNSIWCYVIPEIYIVKTNVIQIKESEE